MSQKTRGFSSRTVAAQGNRVTLHCGVISQFPGMHRALHHVCAHPRVPILKQKAGNYSIVSARIETIMAISPAMNSKPKSVLHNEELERVP